MRRFILILTIMVTACTMPATQEPGPTPTEPVVVIDTPTSQPITTATLPSIPAREQYILNTVVDYDLHRITVDETIIYPNHRGQTLDVLTLAIAANLWVDCFHLNEIQVDGVPVTNYSLSLHRLDVPVPTPLEPDSVSTLTLRYSLNLPFLDQINSGRARIFGYSDIQMNLVNWYPYIVPFQNGEWIIREPWSHGEYLTYPIADFEVNLSFVNPDNAPIVATSGFAEMNGDSTRYTLTESRAFAVSASREFEVSNVQLGDTTVYSYYLPIYRNAGIAALNASSQALQVFSEKFGAYSHKTLSVVVADFKDSMEFSALYFHSRSFYDLYNNSPQSYLVAVAAHETGHQWWFEQIANDQAEEPWLDEALTTYSEAIFYETVHPESLAWWWSTRIDFFEPRGKIDIPVYEGQDADTYKHIVYFNGAHFLKDLRERIGDEAFFGFLQDYLQQEKDKVSTREDFFQVLNERTEVDYSDIVAKYFK